MKESELFTPVKELLINQGCKDVYGEVCNYDVVGVAPDNEFIVEMKKIMNFKVIEQAHQGIGRAKYVYVAIPKPKNEAPNRFARTILNEYGIGLIYIEHDSAFIEIPSAEHDIHWRNIREDVLPHNKIMIGGVKSGDGPTEYSITIDAVKAFMRDRDWVTVEEILQHVDTHYSNPKPSLVATLRATWNESWCERKIIKRKTHFKFKND